MLNFYSNCLVNRTTKDFFSLGGGRIILSLILYRIFSAWYNKSFWSFLLFSSSLQTVHHLLPVPKVDHSHCPPFGTPLVGKETINKTCKNRVAREDLTEQMTSEEDVGVSPVGIILGKSFPGGGNCPCKPAGMEPCLEL